MVEWMDKDIVIHRDGAGNLLPVEETVEFLSNKRVKVLPLTRGEFRAYEHADKKEELLIRLIREHYILPNFTEDDFDKMSWKDINALAWCLLSASTGFAQQYFHDKTMEAAGRAAEDVLKKGGS